MTAAVASSISDQEFDLWFARFRDASYRQGRAYSQLAADRRGAVSELMSIRRGGQLLGVASVRTKRVPLAGTGIAYIDRGPLVSPDGAFHGERMQAAVEALSDVLVTQRGLLLRVKPPSYGGQAEEAVRAALAQQGFRELTEPPQQSFVIDLRQDPEQIRARFNGKWRADLAKAERGSVTVTRATEQESFAAFGALLEQLQQEKSFHSEQDAAFFARCQHLGSQAEQMILHMAWSNDRLVAGHLGSYNGDTAVYVLGATSDEGRALRAAYLLQWEVIQHARRLGLQHYDLGGTDAVNNPDVHRFKQRMGGEAIWNTPGFEKAPGTFSRWIVHGAERLARVRR